MIMKQELFGFERRNKMEEKFDAKATVNVSDLTNLFNDFNRTIDKLQNEVNFYKKQYENIYEKFQNLFEEVTVLRQNLTESKRTHYP